MNEELIPTEELEAILDKGMRGMDLSNYPIRTRSKIVKGEICRLMGYPIPCSFKKVHPRIPVQNLDVYTQKSLNLQIWNESIIPDRRYALVRIDVNNVVIRVKVILGKDLIKYYGTGALTKKYQARVPKAEESQLFSKVDTDNIIEWCEVSIENLISNPSDDPVCGQLMAIRDLFERLYPLVGKKIKKIDAIQERNRGAELHKLVCASL
jgi:hypothetical protein